MAGLPAALLAVAPAPQPLWAQEAGSTLRVTDSPSPLSITPPSTTSGSGLSGLPSGRGLDDLRRTTFAAPGQTEPGPQQSFGQSPYSTAPNYGKPRVKILGPIKPRPPPRPSARQLRPLEAYKNSKIARDLLKRGNRVADPNAPPDTTGGPPKVFDPTLGVPAPSDLPPTVAVVPTIPTKPPLKVDAAPYAPTGIGIGNVRLRPSLETSVGYDSNPNRVLTPKHGSSELRADGALNIQSEWSNHELKGDLRARLRRLSASAYRQPARWRRHAHRPDRRHARHADRSRRALHTDDAAFQPPRTFAEEHIRPHRQSECDAVGRHDLDLAANNFNAYGVTGRAAYEISPKLKPFVEVTADTRRYDQPERVRAKLKRHFDAQAALRIR